MFRSLFVRLHNVPRLLLILVEELRSWKNQHQKRGGDVEKSKFAGADDIFAVGLETDRRVLRVEKNQGGESLFVEPEEDVFDLKSDFFIILVQLVHLHGILTPEGVHLRHIHHGRLLLPELFLVLGLDDEKVVDPSL